MVCEGIGARLSCFVMPMLKVWAKSALTVSGSPLHCFGTPCFMESRCGTFHVVLLLSVRGESFVHSCRWGNISLVHPINEVVFHHIILADSMFRGVAGLFQCLVFHEVPLPRNLRNGVRHVSCRRVGTPCFGEGSHFTIIYYNTDVTIYYKMMTYFINLEY